VHLYYIYATRTTNRMCHTNPAWWDCHYLFRVDERWHDIYSNPILIQLLWCTIVPFASMHTKTKENHKNSNPIYIFTVSILVFMEPYGESIKNFKYYYYVTLIIYEFIGIFSIFTHFYSLMKIYECNDAAFKTLKNFPNDMRRGIVDYSYYISIGYFFFSHWTKNIFVHISLCRYELFDVG